MTTEPSYKIKLLSLFQKSKLLSKNQSPLVMVTLSELPSAIIVTIIRIGTFITISSSSKTSNWLGGCQSNQDKIMEEGRIRGQDRIIIKGAVRSRQEGDRTRKEERPGERRS